jgi:hypothetical protein
MDPLVVVLRAIQNSANNQNSGAPLTWDAINRATQAYGAPDIDYERFAKLYDSDPTIQSMIDNFDGNGIQLKTDKGMEQPMVGQEPKTGMMAAAAKRATKLGK